MKNLVDILPKFTEWRSIPYATDLCCQDCGKCGFDGYYGARKPYPRLIGWCETSYGFMGVFECTECGAKFRFHGGDPIDDIDEFENKLILTFGENCENWDELEKELYN